MKVFGFLAVILALAVSCQGYSFLIPPKQNMPGVCMYHGVMLKRGDNNMMNSCQNLRCNEDGSILVQGCGHYNMRDCRILDPMNLHKPYPDCCRMNFLCTMPNGEVVNREVHPLETGVYA
ncbi:uncharacterized protein LOC133334816 [Musca vetustissima]|uniref:uncharacterized protein LOC133334816 n=1 Tax=Musca vetustissima TaxID=27455 RepID=UPI002AB63A78|nr:uncharacterized protein LOC133334816 [Musca vetustissima]